MQCDRVCLLVLAVFFLFADSALSDGVRSKRNADTFKIKLPTVNHNVNHRHNRPEKKEKKIEPTVMTEEGSLRGLQLTKEDGFKYYAFHGVPYAEKPERFKPAMPAKSWTGVRNATDHGDACLQKDLRTGNILGSEDCLYLNVYTPTLKADSKLAVIVFLHGGWFKFGHSHRDIYNPARLVKRNIIFVSLNYRLGVFGFLNTHTSSAPGNVGMKDTILALRWVKRNIRNFGGDPARVTLYGVSSGARMADFIITTPAARGLVSRAILHGGSMATVIAAPLNTQRMAFRIGKRMGIYTTDINFLVQKLRETEAKDLLESVTAIEYELETVVPFLATPPSVEDDIPGETPVYYDEADTMLKNRANYDDIPIMLVFAENEAYFLLHDGLDVEDFIGGVEDSLEFFFPYYLFRYSRHINDKMRIIEPIKRHFMKGRPITMDNVKSYFDMVTETLAVYSCYKEMKMRVGISKSPVFVGQFAYDSDLGTFHKNVLNISGAGHVEDLAFVLDNAISKVSENQNPTTRLVAERMVEMFANFAETGDPTPETTNLLPVKWFPLKNDKSFDFYRITDKLEMIYGGYKDSIQLIDNTLMSNCRDTNRDLCLRF